jgi:hypothetical protein
MVDRAGRASVFLSAAILSGCPEEWQDEPASLVCDEVGYAIASRTFACTGDDALALERQGAFGDDFTCIAEGPPAPTADLYHCAVAILDLSCDDVDALGDDLAGWLASSPACAYVAVAR